MRDALAELEAWNNSGGKGRWVNIDIDDGYGASCWHVTLGNSSVPSKPGWAPPLSNMRGSRVVAAEVNFTTGKPMENVVVVGDDWCGLGPVILAALDKAKELGV